jgi:hypothetical protein
VANLALADMMVISYIVPCWLLDLALGYLPLVNQLHCRLNSFIMFLSLYSSIYTLVLIGFNRYLSVCRPHLYARLFSSRFTVLCCGVPWLLSCAECVLPLFGLAGTKFEYDAIARICGYNGRDFQGEATSSPPSTPSISSCRPLWLVTSAPAFSRRGRPAGRGWH